MAGLGSLTLTLSANVAALRKDLAQASGNIKRSMRSIEKSANGARVALVGAVGALGVGKLIGTLRTFETLKASLETVTGSSEKAREAFAWIERFAASTPFQLEEVVGGFIKLQSLGLEPTEQALLSFGNTASALGKSLDQFVEAVADAVTGEFERLKEFGIKASKDGERVTFTFRGIATEVANTADAIQGYLENIGNTDFAGAMSRRAASLDGALSNLQDSFGSLARSLGEAGLTDLVTDFALAISTVTNAAAEAAKDGGALSLLEGAFEGIFDVYRGNDSRELGRLLLEEIDLAKEIRERQKEIAEGGFLSRFIDEPALAEAEKRLESVRKQIQTLEELTTGERGIPIVPKVPVIEAKTGGAAAPALDEAAEKAAKKRAEAIAKVTESLKFEIEQLTRSNIQQEIYNELRAAGVDRDSAAGRQIAELVTEREELNDLNDAEIKAQEDLADAAQKRIDTETALRQSEKDALENLQRQILFFGELSEVERVTLETTVGLWAEFSDGAKAAALANAAVIDGLNETQAAQEAAAKAAEEAAKKAAEVGRELGLTFTSAFEDAIVKGESLGDVLKGIEQDLIRLAARKLITEPFADFFSSAFEGGGSGGGGFLSKLLPGFATGAQFAVPGTGSGDTTPIAFMATPGETVTVTPRGESPGGGQTIVLNVNGVTDADSFNRSRGQILASLQNGLALASARNG